MQKTAIPNYQNTSHIVINRLTQQELYKRRRVNAEFVSDGFDFEQEVAQVQKSQLVRIINRTLTDETRDPPNFYWPESSLTVTENDLLLGMMTRIVSNKAIEVAIQFVAALQKKKQLMIGKSSQDVKPEFTENNQIVLVLPNPADEQQNYKQKLLKHAENLGVHIVFIGIDSEKQVEQKQKRKIHHHFTIFIQLLMLLSIPRT